MKYVIWLCGGLVLVAPLLFYANRRRLRENQRIFGRRLLIASSIYVAFAVTNANVFWLAVETLGVATFSVDWAPNTR